MLFYMTRDDLGSGGSDGDSGGSSGSDGDSGGDSGGSSGSSDSVTTMDTTDDHDAGPASDHDSVTTADTTADTTTNASTDTSDSLEKAKTLASAAQAGAVNSATGAARASGLSPSQAALVGANSGASTYQNTLSNTATTYSAQDLEKLLTEEGYDVQTNENTANAVGTGLSGIASLLVSLLSDRGAKEKIHDGWGILDHVVAKLNPKTFAYKSDPKVTRVGVIAQDLEKTPLAYTVKNTSAGKVIDVPQLTGANTAMISDLSHKLDKAMAMWKGGKK
jgi:hypothetical protein